LIIHTLGCPVICLLPNIICIWKLHAHRAAPNYKNSHPLVITLQLPLYPARTLGECIKKWRLEQGLFQGDLAKTIRVDEMTIVDWETGKTKPTEKNIERIKEILGA